MDLFGFVPDFPREGPSIHSKRKQYQVGETADLICTAQNSSPSTQLSWYINGEPANEAYLRLFPPSPDGSRKLGLSFPLSFNHFVMRNGQGHTRGQSHNGGLVGSGNRVRLKCLASISDFYWKSAEITLLQEKPKFASVMTGSEITGESGGTSSDNSEHEVMDVVHDGSSHHSEGSSAVGSSKATRLSSDDAPRHILVLLFLSASLFVAAAASTTASK